MEQLLKQLSNFFGDLPNQLRRRRLWVWLSFFLLTAFMVTGLGRLEKNLSLDAYFSDDDPVKIFYDEFRDIFGSDEVVFIVYEPVDNDLFSKQTLAALEKVQEELMVYDQEEERETPLNHITEVTSLWNASYLEVDNDSLISREFIAENRPTSEADRKRLREEALGHPNYPRTLISEDGRFSSILIRTDFGTEPLDEVQKKGRPPRFKMTPIEDYAAFMKEVQQILDKPEYQKALKFYLVGNPVVMNFLDKVFQEAAPLFLAMYLVIFGILFFLFRSFSTIVWSLAVVLVTILWMFGGMGWTQMPLTTMTNVNLMLALAVGVADAVHIMSGYLFFRRKGLDHENALSSVMKKSAVACFLTSLTTVVGLLSLALVPIMPIRVFGLSAALGVSVAFFLTVIILPLMLDLWAPVPKKQVQKKSGNSLVTAWLKSIGPFAIRYQKGVTLGFLLFAGVMLVGLSKVKIDANVVEMAKEGDPLRIAYDLAGKHMSGGQGLEIILSSEKEDTFKNPEILKTMDAFQNSMEKKHSHFILESSSIVDVLKLSYKQLNEGREEMYIVPERRDMVAQTLFLFDNANAEDRQKLMTDNYQTARITFQVVNRGTYEYAQFFKTFQEDMDQFFAPLQKTHPDLKIKYTGTLALIMTMDQYISWSQIQSFGIALLIISLLLLGIFGSLKIGLLAVLPNLFPVISAFGVLGWLGIPLDSTTLIIAPVIIGIAVDDTIHFFTHYRLEMKANGGNVKEAIDHTIGEVGQAITFTSLILGIGFFTLVFSSMKGISIMAYIGTFAIFIALLSDLYFLPALLSWVGHKETPNKKNPKQ